MKEIVNLLLEGKHSLVISSSENIMTLDGRGVKDLFQLLTNRSYLLRGAKLADKVVGKGAAALMVLGGVREVYAHTISKPALDLLTSARIVVSYGELVPQILNRAGDGQCPVELLCIDCQTAEECLPKITTFINKNNLKV